MLKPNACFSHQKPRPLNPLICKQVEEQLTKWERQGVIQKAIKFHPHSSPLVPVIKKNGIDVRLAIDYRRLNAQSVEQTYPIASITEALTSLSG